MAIKPTGYHAICPRHMQICSCLHQGKRFINMKISRNIIFAVRMCFQNTCTLFFSPQANFIVVCLFLSGALVSNSVKMKASLLSCQLEATICKL